MKPVEAPFCHGPLCGLSKADATEPSTDPLSARITLISTQAAFKASKPRGPRLRGNDQGGGRWQMDAPAEEKSLEFMPIACRLHADCMPI